jgi:hypothetical protein
MDINIKRLSECTFNEALQAWNEGFKGYYSDATMTEDVRALSFYKGMSRGKLNGRAFGMESP